MRIVLITQYFWPESFIINELIEILAQQGHTVKVLTGKPNYPDGEIYEGYKKEGILTEHFSHNVSVYRVPLRPRGKGGAKNLILNYLSFVINGLRFFPAAIKGESYDVVFAFGLSPITSIIPAIFLKWRLKTHLAVWIQDLWPESLKATGFVRNRFLLWLTGQLVRSIYFCSDTILAQSHGFKAPIMRYAKENKIVYYPNSYNDSSMTVSQVSSLPEQLLNQLSSNFCIVFAGNLGTAQSLNTLVEAAERLKDLPAFRLVLVGSGSMSDWLIEQKREKSLDNIILAGRHPAHEMPHIFSRAAALLVSLKNDEIFSYTIPSKIQAYLAAGKPIIAALDGEGARVVKEAGAGLTCPAEDADALVDCIRTLYILSLAEREQMGASGRSYFLEHFNMPTQANKLIEILDQRIKAAK